jgi:hypothetical protein
LTFDISKLSRFAGSSFDVNKIHVWAYEQGASTLETWLDNWEKHNGRRELPLLYGNDLSNKYTISICVGFEVQLRLIPYSSEKLQSIFLWYDGQTSPLGVDDYCKVYLPNPLVERFRDKNTGKLVINMTPADGKVYYYASAPLCPVTYYSVYSNIPDTSGGDSDPAGSSPPVTGGKHPGDLPDIIVNDHFLTDNDGSKTQLTQLHVGQVGWCAIQVKNVGEAGAWDDFQTRCYISKGNWQDKNPPSPGHATIHGSVGLRTGASRFVHIPMEPFTWPSRYNMTACTNTDGGVKESDDGNNCQEEYVFDVVSNTNLVISSLTPSKTTLQPLEVFSVSIVTANSGENFGRDTQSTAIYVDGILLENRWITRENLRGGATVTETFTVTAGIVSSGTHIITGCADFNSLIPETNESDNCTSTQITVEVPWSPPTPETIILEGKEPLPLELACGEAPTEPNFTISPVVETGDLGVVTIGSNRQRIFIPSSNISNIGQGFWGAPTLDISMITKWCWNSNQTNWTINNSIACGVPSKQSDGSWWVDIPKTPRASKGTWSIGYQTQDQVVEYWANLGLWTSVPLDADGHLRYGGWEPNRLELSVNSNNSLVLTANFGAFGLPGFWHPPEARFTSKAFWHTTTDNDSGISGNITCNPATGKLSATIVGATLGSTGRIILGTTTPYLYGWQGTDWALPNGVGFVDTDGNYTLPVSSLSLTISNVSKTGGTVTSNVGGIVCSSTCSSNLASGTLVTLIAIPADGYQFSGWGGACSGNGNSCVLAIDAAKAVTAKFEVFKRKHRPIWKRALFMH